MSYTVLGVRYQTEIERRIQDVGESKNLVKYI